MTTNPRWVCDPEDVRRAGKSRLFSCWRRRCDGGFIAGQQGCCAYGLVAQSRFAGAEMVGIPHSSFHFFCVVENCG